MEKTKGLIRELVDTKHGRAVSALLAIAGTVATVATAPVVITAVGSAAAIAGGGLLATAAANEFNKGRKL